MTCSFHSGAIALTFLVSMGVANAQDTAPGNTKRPPGSSQAQGLTQLSPAQKEMIFTQIRRSNVQVNRPAGNTYVAVGARVPSSTELYSMPRTAATKVPAAKGYVFTIVNDTLVLVDPASRRIVTTARQ